MNPFLQRNRLPEAVGRRLLPFHLHPSQILWATYLIAMLSQPLVQGCQLTSKPTFVDRMLEEDVLQITIICPCCSSVQSLYNLYSKQKSPVNRHNQSELSTLNQTSSTNVSNIVYILIIDSESRQVAMVRSTSVRQEHDDDSEDLCYPFCNIIMHPLPLSGTSVTFYTEGHRVGRTNISISILSQERDGERGLKQTHLSQHASSQLLEHVRIPISVIRKQRIFYTVFDFSAAFIASLIALSVGCCTDLDHLKAHLGSPLHLLMAVGIQHICMPLIAFVISISLNLADDIAFGLVAIATVPGGGLAHLVVFLMDGDQQLSTAISFLNSLLNFLTSWIWLFLLCAYWRLPLDIKMIFVWLSPVLFSHSLGLFMKYFCPNVAEAVLTWFTRPLLLLSAILLITLGVYINHYAFHFVNYTVAMAIMLLICGGFCLGGALAFFSKREKPILKTLAAEMSVFNCLIVIPTMRYSLPQPDADLAATVPLWGVFFTPTPVIIYFVVHKVKAWVLAFVKKRKEKQYKHYSIVSSLAKMVEDVSAMSAPIRMDANHLDGALEKEERTTSV